MPSRLVDLCLDTIVENFRRYNSSFQASGDETMKYMLEFLRRKYSYDLLVRLSAKEDSMEEFVDLLINKHLKSIDTSWLRNCTWEKVVSKMAEIGSTVEQFSLQEKLPSECYKQTPWEDILCYLPNLKRLTCHEYNIKLIFKNVAKYCVNIEEINLHESCVTLSCFEYLCNDDARCTKLKKITFSKSSISDECIQYLLEKLPSLDIDYPKLYLILYSLHKDDLPSLTYAAPYKITRLELVPETASMSPKLYNDAVKVCLNLCPHLKYLNYKLLSKDSIVLSPLPELEELQIGKFFPNSPAINIDEFLKIAGKKLTSLSIYDCTVSLSALAESCPRVRELNFCRVNFHLDDDSKPVFNSLSSCAFQYTDVSRNAKVINLVLTSSSSKLETLTFENCNLITYIKGDKDTLYRYGRDPTFKISIFTSLKKFAKDIILIAPDLKNLSVETNFQYELLTFTKSLTKSPEIDLFTVQLD